MALGGEADGPYMYQQALLEDLEQAEVLGSAVREMSTPVGTAALRSSSKTSVREEAKYVSFRSEIILNSVSRRERGCPNVFMVGDVKQSIYRFRLARPELFMEKYRTYPQTEEGDALRIDLHKGHTHPPTP